MEMKRVCTGKDNVRGFAEEVAEMICAFTQPGKVFDIVTVDREAMVDDQRLSFEGYTEKETPSDESYNNECTALEVCILHNISVAVEICYIDETDRNESLPDWAYWVKEPLRSRLKFDKQVKERYTDYILCVDKLCLADLKELNAELFDKIRESQNLNEYDSYFHPYCYVRERTIS